jgi:hypothetical protein
MRYAYVKDGEIVEGPRSLPTSWGNTSGFNLMPEAELRQLGWLPWRFIEAPSPGPDWIQTTSAIEVSQTEVTETKAYRQKTDKEIADELAQKAWEIRERRAEAYRLEADPLFFKAERGEVTREEWLAKVEEIRNRYPT